MVFNSNPHLFTLLSSCSTWSNSLADARKRIAVTESKHWNHFWRCVLCPPTSTNKKGTFSITMGNSMMPFVVLRQYRMSCWVGTNLARENDILS